MRDYLRSHLDQKDFWSTLVFLNVALIFLQPAILVLSLMFVGSLYAVIFVLDGLRGESFWWLARKTTKVLLWYCLFVLSTLPAFGVCVALAGKSLEDLDRAPGWVTPTALGSTAAVWAGTWLFIRWRRTERTRRAEERGAREYAARDRDRATAQKRREDARAKCEIFFGLHGPEIRSRFSKAMYEDFVRRHLGDDHPPDHVEERARQLLDLLQDHLDRIEPPEKPMDVGDLAAWYKETRAQIESLDLDERTKRVQVSQLNARYAELVQEQIENLQP